MASDRLTNFPVALTAGTNLRIDLSLDDFLASANGTIIVYFKGPSIIPITDFTLSTDDDAFTIDVAASITTKWKAGIYNYTVTHTDTATIVEPALKGKIEILPDPANQTVIEARSFLEIMVVRIEALLKELALDQYKQVLIQDKQYTLQNLPELEELLQDYRAQLFAEEQAIANKQGNYKQYDVSFQFTD